MAISKKDYQAIAGMIYQTREYCIHNGEEVSALNMLVTRMSDYLACDNPRFNRALFIEACTTGKTRGMRQVKVS